MKEFKGTNLGTLLKKLDLHRHHISLITKSPEAKPQLWRLSLEIHLAASYYYSNLRISKGNNG